METPALQLRGGFWTAHQDAQGVRSLSVAIA